MKRLMAAVVLAACALTGCSSPSDSPQEQQTQEETSRHSADDLRRAMESVGMAPSEVSAENADPSQMLENASVEPEECRVLLDVTQGEDLGTDLGLTARTDSASYFAAANSSGDSLKGIVDNARRAAADCPEVTLTMAGGSVKATVRVKDDVSVAGADDVAAVTAEAEVGGQTMQVSSVSASKDNVLVTSVLSHGGRIEQATDAISDMFQELSRQ